MGIALLYHLIPCDDGIASVGHSTDSSSHVHHSLEMSCIVRSHPNHYYTNFTGGGHFRFSAAGKAVRRGLEAMVNRGLTAVGGLARRC